MRVDASVTEWALRALVISVVGALVAAVVRLIGRIRTNELALAEVREATTHAAAAAASAASASADVAQRIAECERTQTEIRARIDAAPPPTEWRQWSADLAAMRASIDGLRDMVVGLNHRVGEIDDHLRERRP